jgi:tRNA-2-methylthio-N6-dimethylallyladenosine synthase
MTPATLAPTRVSDLGTRQISVSMPKEKKYFVYTFGCQMNYSDSERAIAILEKIGFKSANNMEDADFVLFNTCSIRQKAEDRAFGLMSKINKWRRKRPHILIGVTGCMARIASSRNSAEKDDLLKRIDILDLVFPIKDLVKLPKLLAELDPEASDFEDLESSTDNYFHINPKQQNGFQRFLPIMSGCDKFCTYCIVPYSRGREWSRPMDEILLEAEKMVADGAIEITVVGQNVNSYGITIADKKKDGLFDYSDLEKNPPFVQLLKKIDALKSRGLKRLRFTSSNPWNFSAALVYAIRDLETLMPYVHLPLQSGNDNVLQRMNRSHSREHYMHIINLLRQEVPNCTLTTDLIVGFCGETEAEFMDTYNLYRDLRWDMAYLAQYSSRRGTIATKLMTDDVPREEKRRRWHMLNDLMSEISLENNQKYIGEVLQVLVERNKEGVNIGRSAEFKEVYFASKRDFTGQIVPVKIKRAKEWILEGLAV